MLNTAINGTFKVKAKKNTNPKFPINKWFNDECETLKTNVNSYANSHDISMTMTMTMAIFYLTIMYKLKLQS